MVVPYVDRFDWTFPVRRAASFDALYSSGQHLVALCLKILVCLPGGRRKSLAAWLFIQKDGAESNPWLDPDFLSITSKLSMSCCILSLFSNSLYYKALSPIVASSAAEPLFRICTDPLVRMGRCLL